MMTDCRLEDIPEELIESKGDFSCQDDYAPTGDLIGHRLLTMPTVDTACGNGWLFRAIPETFPMTLTFDSDEFKSWESELFTTDDAPILPIPSPFATYTHLIRKELAGICQQSPINNASYYYEYDPYLWEGEPFNYGYCGRTIQFYFNLYKKYCCIYTNGIITDYYYLYFYSIFTAMDGRIGHYCSCGQTNFCFENWSIMPTGTADSGLPYYTCYFGVSGV